MTLLDAAKTMADQEPLLEEYGTVHACVYCRAPRFSSHVFIPEQPHETTCPWLTLPRIVKALEVAELMLDKALVGHVTDDYRGWYTCASCGAEQEWSRDFPHKPDCSWAEFVSVLKGEPDGAA